MISTILRLAKQVCIGPTSWKEHGCSDSVAARRSEGYRQFKVGHPIWQLEGCGVPGRAHCPLPRRSVLRFSLCPLVLVNLVTSYIPDEECRTKAARLQPNHPGKTRWVYRHDIGCYLMNLQHFSQVPSPASPSPSGRSVFSKGKDMLKRTFRRRVGKEVRQACE